MTARRFVIGDIHGAHKALLQCFEKSSFDRQKDLLICLGDLGDGWPDVPGVFNELLSLHNLILLKGNHDIWLLNWFETGEAPDIWLMQGGDVTLLSMRFQPTDTYVRLLKDARTYYILENMLFVHGGFIPDYPIEKQDKEILLWDRSLVKAALCTDDPFNERKLTSFDRVYVGHTPTIHFNETRPLVKNGVCLMDTGAGWPGGVLSMMDIDTGNIYQSDVVSDIYTETKGRVF
jgi:serine/threonine protein phosphatase 1